MRLRIRLLLITAVPAATMLGFAAVQMQSDLQDCQANRQTAEQAAFAVRCGNLLHELQRERGLTGGYLASGGAQYGTELKAQRRNTDAAASQWTTAIEQTQGALGQLLENPRQLAAWREQVDGQLLGTAAATDWYTAWNQRLLETIADLAVSAPSMALRFSAYEALLRGKEHTGLVRAIGNATVAAGKWQAGGVRSFAAATASAELWLAHFATLGGETASEQLAASMAAPASAEASRLQQQLLGSDAGTLENTGAAQWWAALSSKLDALQAIEQRTATELIQDAELAAHAAERAWWTTAVISALALLATAGLVFGLSRHVLQAVQKLRTAIAGLADGDLNVAACVRGKDEVAECARMFDTSVSLLAQAMSTVADTSVRVDEASRQITAASNTIACSASEQAASLEEVRGTMAEVAKRVESVAASVSHAGQRSQQASALVSRGQQSTERMQEAMLQIRQSSDAVASILRTIDDIAFQTNLLALNAAVEAARAGDAGKGFAVVAEEVRHLAGRCSKSAAEIGKLVRESVERTSNGVQLTEEVEHLFRDIRTSAEEVAAMLNSVSEGSTRECESLQVIERAVAALDGVTQGNASSAEELAASVASTQADVQRLREELQRFQFAGA